jgi:Transposase DDE domain
MTMVETVTTSLQCALGVALDDLARETGVIERQRKFTGQALLRMIVITLLHKPDATMWDFHVTAVQLGLEISYNGVKNRFAAGQPLVDFLRQALQRALQKTVAAQPALAELLQHFTAVFLGDSSTITLPDELAHLFAGCGGKEGTSAAALKIQVLWDIKSGRLERLVVEAGKASDARSCIAAEPAEQVDPGTLLIYDLGYFSVERFAKLDSRQARFISRLQHGKERLRCRLIGVRVPDEVANRRRQQAREKARKHGREPSAEYMELLGWSLFVTNCTAEELTWKAVVVLYRARWQIELLFKLWKSHNGLARCRPGASPLEQLAVFYAKLLGVLLQHWLLLATAWQCQPRSFSKAARLLNEKLKDLLLAVDNTARVLEILLERHRLIQQMAQVEARKKNLSHPQLLDNPELLDWLA